jgi:hypothetical protein
MRKIAIVLLLALVGGCRGDYENPWDSSNDVQMYQQKTEDDWNLELIVPFDPPQHQPLTLIDSDLEAWRDTVLATAQPDTLARMEEGSARKVAAIEARIVPLVSVDELTRREQLRVLLEQLRIEKLRLRLIGARLHRGNEVDLRGP